MVMAAPPAGGYRSDRCQPGLAEQLGCGRIVDRRATVGECLEPGEGVLGRGAAGFTVANDQPSAGPQCRRDPRQAAAERGATPHQDWFRSRQASNDLRLEQWAVR